MKRVLKSSLSFILAITIIFSSAYVGLSEVDFDGLFAVEAKAADFSDIYKDELFFMSPERAKQFIGFIFNVPTDRVSTDEKSIDIVYNYLTGVYTKGTLEYNYAQDIFLLMSETFINRNLNENEKVFNISTSNLITDLEAEVGSDSNVAQDVLNGAVGGVKGHIKKIFYYVGEFDLDDTMVAIDTAMSGYQTITGLKGKVEDLVLAVKSIVNTTFAVTSNNSYKSYLYYSTYFNNRYLGPDCVEVLMSCLGVGQNFFDGLVNIFDSIGFGNSWTNEDIQYLIRTFAEFTYHSKLESQNRANNTSGSGSMSNTTTGGIEFSQSSYSLATNETIQFTSCYYSSTEQTYITVTYSSSNTSVFTVTKDGLVTPVNEGTAQLIATTSDGATATCEIIVYVPKIYIEKVNLPEESVELAMNMHVTMTAGYSPSDANTDTGIRYSSSDESVFTVDSSGKVTPVGEGIANFIATSDNGIQGSCKITVYPYNISENEIGYTIDEYLGSTLNVSIPSSINGVAVTSVGDRAFEDCISFKSLIIPDTVTSIGKYAFSDCSNLETITIGNGIINVGYSAFYPCDKLSSVYITDIGAWCNINFDFAANPLGDGVNLYLNGELVTNLVIPNNVTNIEDKVFDGYKNLVSVTIPDSVTHIGSWAFSNCSNLETVTVGTGVTYVGSYAFYHCYKLSSVYITDIGAWCTIDFQAHDSNPLYYAKNLYINGELATAANIPNSVTSIGSYAFSGYENLTSVTIPDGVINIGDNAFSGCTNLSSITLPDSLLSIGFDAFAFCRSLSSISLPKELTSIDSGAFRCTNLASITIPENLPVIYSGVFEGCENLVSVTLPDSLTDIGCYAFVGCKNLASIKIPKSVISIGDSAFEGCTSLTSFDVDENNNSYSSLDGVLYNKDKTTLIQYPANKTNTKYAIPNSVTTICDSAFLGCGNLEFVKISDAVKAIPFSLFKECTHLATVEIPGSVTTIGADAFIYCTSLTSIVIPDNVTSIGEFAFYDCANLESITVSSSIKNIDRYAFYGCDNLKYIFYAGSAEDIGSITIANNNDPLYSAAVHCNAKDHGYIEKVDAEATCTQNGSKHKECNVCGYSKDFEVIYASGHSYSNEWIIDVAPTCTEDGSKSHHCTVCGEKADVTVIAATGHIPSEEWEVVEPTCTEYGSKTRYCTVCGEATDYIELEPVGHNTVDGVCQNCGFGSDWQIKKIDDGLEIVGYIGSDVDVAIPDSLAGLPVTSIGESAFKGCKTLETILIPANITNVIGGAFSFCSNLTAINVDENNAYYTSVDGILFSEDMTELVTYPKGNQTTEYTIPDSVTSVGKSAFYNCGNLTSVTIPESVTSIGQEAFRQCTNLTSVVIPDSVISLGGAAFMACGLTSVVVGEGITEIYPSTFMGCANLMSVTIPVTLTKVHVFNFESSKNIKYVFYAGTQEQWCEISLASSSSVLNSAVIHYEATGHIYSDWNITSQVTCTEDGSRTKACSVCGDEVTETMVSSGHNYIVQNSDDNHPHTDVSECSFCNDIKEETQSVSDCYVCIYGKEPPIEETSDTEIDYMKFVVRTNVETADEISDVLGLSENAIVTTTPSYIYGDIELYGTGTVITVFDGNEYVGDYTLVVNGDTNGDSVVDALDAAQVALVSNGQKSIDGAYKMAADSNSDDEINIDDYQAIVNKVVA